MLENAILIRPDHIPSRNNLAKAYFLARLPELAIAAYEEVLLRDPSNAIALNNLMLLAEAAGNHDAAATYRRRLEAGRAVPQSLPSKRESRSRNFPPGRSSPQRPAHPDPAAGHPCRGTTCSPGPGSQRPPRTPPRPAPRNRGTARRPCSSLPAIRAARRNRRCWTGSSAASRRRS